MVLLSRMQKSSEKTNTDLKEVLSFFSIILQVLYKIHKV